MTFIFHDNDYDEVKTNCDIKHFYFYVPGVINLQVF